MIKRGFTFFVTFFISVGLLSQEEQRYFEDQFYLGLAYNSLGGKVQDFKENS